MNEELQKALSELLGKANSGIDAASGFLSAELPEVIQQLLMWHGVFNFILFLVGFVFLVCLSKTINKCLCFTSKAKKDYEDGKDWTRFSKGSDTTSSIYDEIGLVYFIVPVQLVIGLCTINLEWLQIWLAPKVWLIEYAAKLAA